MISHSSTVLSVDYYADLGVNEQASTGEIRQAFRQLALKYHPDRNPNDPEAEQNFIKIAQGIKVFRHDFVTLMVLFLYILHKCFISLQDCITLVLLWD